MSRTPDAPIRAERFYRPELDAFRFLAFLGVFIHHKSNPMLLLPILGNRRYMYDVLNLVHVTGAYGVWLFFLLSGFLITSLLRRETAQAGRVDIGAFYLRRVLRIWPLYFVFLALLWLLSVSGYANGLTGGFFASAALFIVNWYMAVHGLVWLPAAPIWTISIEEQFYAFWPLLLRRPTAVRIRWIAAASILISQLTVFVLHAHGDSGDWQISYNTLAVLQFFGLGALMALREPPAGWSLPASRRVLLAGLGLLALVVAAATDPRSGLPFTPAITDPPLLDLQAVDYNVLFTLTALGSLLLFRAFLGAPARYFPRWVLRLGRLTYGLYLFDMLSGYLARDLCRGHLPAPVELPVTFAIDLGLALLARRFVERPFLRLKARWEIVPTRLQDHAAG